METSHQKGHKTQCEFTNDIMENLQDTSENLPDEQQSISATLRTITTKVKRETSSLTLRIHLR